MPISLSPFLSFPLSPISTLLVFYRHFHPLTLTYNDLGLLFLHFVLSFNFLKERGKIRYTKEYKLYIWFIWVAKNYGFQFIYLFIYFGNFILKFGVYCENDLFFFHNLPLDVKSISKYHFVFTIFLLLKFIYPAPESPFNATHMIPIPR